MGPYWCLRFWYLAPPGLLQDPRAPVSKLMMRGESFTIFHSLMNGGLEVSSRANKIGHQVACWAAVWGTGLPSLCPPPSLGWLLILRDCFKCHLTSSDRTSLIFSVGFLVQGSLALHPVHHIHDAFLMCDDRFISFCVYGCPRSPPVSFTGSELCLFFSSLYPQCQAHEMGLETLCWMDGRLDGQTDICTLQPCCLAQRSTFQNSPGLSFLLGPGSCPEYTDNLPDYPPSPSSCHSMMIAVGGKVAVIYSTISRFQVLHWVSYTHHLIWTLIFEAYFQKIRPLTRSQR